MFVKSISVTLNLSRDYNFNIRMRIDVFKQKDAWALADKLGAFDYIIEYTHTCYLGVEGSCHDT